MQNAGTGARSIPAKRINVRRSAALLVAIAAVLSVSQRQVTGQDEFRFRSGVELINVTATVTDQSGRFVPGLTLTDFIVYEDDQPVEVSHFSSERVPVSLGIVLDTSGSMAGEKMRTARAAIERFLDQLLDPDDEVFLYGFASGARLLQDWTTNRATVSASLWSVYANGGTAMFDAVVEAVPKADSGRHRKKAIVLISDGDDTNSRAGVSEVRAAVRETEVLVYAIGIDGADRPRARRSLQRSRHDQSRFPSRAGDDPGGRGPRSHSSRRRSVVSWAGAASTSRHSARSPTTAAVVPSSYAASAI